MARLGTSSPEDSMPAGGFQTRRSMSVRVKLAATVPELGKSMRQKWEIHQLLFVLQ
jgi:hypothetical protein